MSRLRATHRVLRFAQPLAGGLTGCREMLTRCTHQPDVLDDFPVQPAARSKLRDLAHRHGLDSVRWWPPNEGDLVVEGLPLSLRQLRADLEQALGCKVAIYLADCLADDTRQRLLSETVSLVG